jgi:hypothetical protein
MKIESNDGPINLDDDSLRQLRVIASITGLSVSSALPMCISTVAKRIEEAAAGETDSERADEFTPAAVDFRFEPVPEDAEHEQGIETDDGEEYLYRRTAADATAPYVLEIARTGKPSELVPMSVHEAARWSVRTLAPSLRGYVMDCL